MGADINNCSRVQLTGPMVYLVCGHSEGAPSCNGRQAVKRLLVLRIAHDLR